MTHTGNVNCDLLGYYATSCVKFLQTFRDNLSVPSSRGLLGLQDGTNRLYQKLRYEIIITGCVINQKSAVFIYFAEEA